MCAKDTGPWRLGLTHAAAINLIPKLPALEPWRHPVNRLLGMQVYFGGDERFTFFTNTWGELWDSLSFHWSRPCSSGLALSPAHSCFLSLSVSFSPSPGYLLLVEVSLVQMISTGCNVVRQLYLFTACHVSYVFIVMSPKDGALLSMLATAEGSVPSNRWARRENSACSSENPRWLMGCDRISLSSEWLERLPLTSITHKSLKISGKILRLWNLPRPFQTSFQWILAQIFLPFSPAFSWKHWQVLWASLANARFFAWRALCCRKECGRTITGEEEVCCFGMEVHTSLDRLGCSRRFHRQQALGGVASLLIKDAAFPLPCWTQTNLSVYEEEEEKKTSSASDNQPCLCVPSGFYETWETWTSKDSKICLLVSVLNHWVFFVKTMNQSYAY